MDYKIKIITGFRSEQFFTIDAEEAHKAYYLFLNPEQRAVFSNGVALIGKNIQGIEPDYNATMGWNPTYEPDDFDWNELREKGIDKKLRNILAGAKEVAYNAHLNLAVLKQPLSEVYSRVYLKEKPDAFLEEVNLLKR